jgi:hypothetical protein
MQNIVPARTLERRSRRMIGIALLSALGGVFFVALGLFLFAISFVVPSNPNFDLYDIFRQAMIFLGVAIILIAIGMVIRALTWRMDNELAEKTANALQDFLDDRYVFIRNVSKQSLGYIDAVLVGPNGVLVFRITDRLGIYFNEKGNWLKQRDKGDWRTSRWNPTREATEDIKRLRIYLDKQGIQDTPVFGVIVFLEDRPLVQFSVQEPVVPVVYTDALNYELNDSYFARERIDAPTIRRIVTQLMN